MAERVPKLKDYLGGAGLANTPTFFLTFILSFIESEIPTMFLYIVTFITVFAGTVIAGFLVAVKATSHYIQVGAVVGLVSFIVHTIYFMLVLRSMIGDWWIAVGFFLGGCAGAKLQEMTRRNQAEYL